jgi:hypothetical protein
VRVGVKNDGWRYCIVVSVVTVCLDGKRAREAYGLESTWRSDQGRKLTPWEFHTAPANTLPLLYHLGTTHHPPHFKLHVSTAPYGILILQPGLQLPTDHQQCLRPIQETTKKDLRAHPLVTQLQSCNSSSAILAVLQQQLQGLDQSRASDDRWTQWLDPTVNVLFTLSATLGEGVGLVCVKT